MARVKNNETLNFQIDKLSEAIESMMKGFETLQTPRALDSDMIRVKPKNPMHVGLTGDSDISDPDSFYQETEYDPERLLLYFDRVSMINEDYREYENRRIKQIHDNDVYQNSLKITNILEDICNRIHEMYNIELPFNDLEDFLVALEKIFYKQIDCSLVELHGLILKLCEIIQQEKLLSTKINISDTIISINIKERPRRRFQKPDYSANYDSATEKLLQDKDLPEEIKNLCRVKKNFLVNINLEKMRNMEINSIREDLEQKAYEDDQLKKKLNSQLESFIKISKQFRQKDIELIKLQEKIEVDREEFQQEKQHIEDLEINYLAKVQEIKARISELFPELVNSMEIKPRASVDSSASTGRFSPICPQFRTFTPVSPSINSLESNDNLIALQKELSMLESQPQDNNSQLRIIRLKTQISAIRSNIAMNNSFRRSTGFTGKMSNDHSRNASNSSINEFPICASPIPRSGCSSPIVTDSISANSNKRIAPKPPPTANRKLPAKREGTSDDLDIIKNQLKLQESRLKQREDLLEEKESRLQRTWMKLPNAEELVTLVQKELSYLKIIKQDYEDKYEELNTELLTFAKKTSQIKSKERDLENKIIEAGKEKKALEEEKKIIEQKFESILNLIEKM